jgi:aminoglycoside phosphotransferase family enzyme
VSAGSARAEPALAEKVEAMRDPARYPGSVRRIDAIETHYAWVFLTETHAYKLKKPMWVDRMDHRALGARRASCIAELRLNHRLAPGVYEAVVALARDERGELGIGRAGGAVEWLVKMRRLPREAFLDRAIAAGTASRPAVRAAAEHLADFYRRAAPVPIEPGAYVERIAAQVAANRKALLETDLGLPRSRVEAVEAAQRDFLAHRAGLLAARAAAGRYVEGHGDLRPEHVHIGTPPCVIDCLEFDHDLRLLDPAEELEYLALECDLLEAPWIGEVFADAYRAATGDAPPRALREFYRAHRAARRALIVGWHLRDPAYRELEDWRSRVVAYLRLAEPGASGSTAAPR